MDIEEMMRYRIDLIEELVMKIKVKLGYCPATYLFQFKRKHKVCRYKIGAGVD